MCAAMRLRDGDALAQFVRPLDVPGQPGRRRRSDGELYRGQVVAGCVGDECGNPSRMKPSLRGGSGESEPAFPNIRDSFEVDHRLRETIPRLRVVSRKRRTVRAVPFGDVK